MVTRLLLKELQATRKSILLLGPRQVGKSTLIHALKPDLEINLAEEAEFFRFQTELDELERRVQAARPRTVFIDEIQRIPRLTNTVQALIDRNPKLRFFMTGSSARKLRRGRANLLPGRVLSFQLAPLSLLELREQWNDRRAMQLGTLPGVYLNASPTEAKRLLQSYTSIYLREEIMAEALVRQMDGFFRFIQAAAFEAGSYTDYSKIAKRAKVSRQSVTRHFEILEDTLVGTRLWNDPELDPDLVDLVKHPRFFFFDQGVLNALRGSFDVHAERIGFLFEHLVFNQISNTASGMALQHQFHNFRTRGGLEVDFILNLDGKRFAIECKSGEEVSSSELNPLRELKRYYPKIQKRVFYRGKRALKDGDIWILPLEEGLKSIFHG